MIVREDPTVSSIWIGELTAAERAEYFREDRDDEVFRSEFAADIGARYLDHDLIEVLPSEVPRPAAVILGATYCGPEMAGQLGDAGGIETTLVVLFLGREATQGTTKRLRHLANIETPADLQMLADR